jgi:hypothetical protein
VQRVASDGVEGARAGKASDAKPIAGDGFREPKATYNPRLPPKITMRNCAPVRFGTNR